MRTYTYSEARQRLAALLDQARREGRVQIRRQDGSTFVLQPVPSIQSPLDVPGVSSRLRPGELVELVRAERERTGDSAIKALSSRRPSQAASRAKSKSPAARKK
jgi:hypothetical protein